MTTGRIRVCLPRTMGQCAAAALVAALLLCGCDTADRASGAPAPTPTYDPFQSHGCKTCDLQQRRVQATMTAPSTP